MSTQGTVDIVEGDITRERADAIVNAANAGLAVGGGVCGAIFRAVGQRQLTDACARIGRCPTGSAVATPAFGITTARIIVHAVGPIYNRYAPDEARRLLGQTYRAAIDVAIEHECVSIAIPAISTGIYGYPLKEACAVAFEVCFGAAGRHAIEIKLVAFDGHTAESLRHAFADVTGRKYQSDL